MDVALIVLLAGAAIFAFIWGVVRRRNRDLELSGDIEQTLQEVPLSARGDAVLVSREHGQLIYANVPARAWLGLNGGDPNLERIARIAQPSDNFLELFSGEKQVSFQLGQRWVEASSHRIPTGTETRTVIVMRELTSGSSNPDALDLSLAMTIINQIGETVNASLGVEQTMQTLLSIMKQHIVFDAGEINLKDDATQMYQPRGWTGEALYLVSLAEYGGAYAMDEGITGWIARHQKPVMYDRRGQTDVFIQPKVPNGPFPNIIGVPLMLGDRLIGTLELASRLPGRFKQAQLSLLQAVSKPVAVAIYNASLYADQVRRIEDITHLQQAVEERSSIDNNPAPVYATLNQRIASLMDADMSGIFLYDETRRGLAPMLPFHGLPDALARAIFITMPSGSPQRDIWERQSEWISNTVNDEPLVEALGLKAIIGVAGIRNTAWLPMQISSDRIGVLAVSNKRGEEGFTPRDILALRALASQAAIVVENLRLFQREKRLDAELEGLQEITYAIGALSHEGEFYQEITERIARLMEIAMCGILLYDEDSKQLVSRLPFYGLSDDAVRNYTIPLTPNTAMEQLWEEENYWYTNNVSTNALTFAAGLDQLAARLGVQKSLLAVLATGGRRIGIVQVSNKLNGQDFNESDARLLLIFATQAASIIENARLFREVQRSSEQAQKLRRIAEIAGTVATSDEGIVALLHEIAGVTQSPIVFINVMDSQTGTLITYPRWMLGAELTEPIVQDAYAPGFEHSVVMSRRPYLSNSILDDKAVLPGYRQVASRFGLTKCILVPLIIGEKSLGELGICNRDGVYDDDDVIILQTIASQISSALDRLLIYEAAGQNLNRRLEELDAISRVSNELTLTLDFDQILNVIRKESLRATGASGCTVALLVPQERWRHPDQPEMERRLGNQRVMTRLADIELEAISRGADSVVVNDYLDSDMSASPPEARSALAATIMYINQVVGVLHVYHEDANRFDDRAAAFLMTLSTKASLGHGNSVRFQEQIDRSERLRGRVEQLNRIFELGHMLHNNSDQYAIMEAVAFSVQQSVGYDSVVMLMVDEEAGLLRRVANAGMPVDVYEKTKDQTISIKKLNSMLKEKYNMSESYFFPVEEMRNWFVDEAVTLSVAFDGNRTIEYIGNQTWRDGDMLLVTLNGANGKLIGLMSLDRPHNNRRPDRGTIEVLEIFAHQAATTLENSRLYQESVRNAEQEARLNEVMEAVSSTLDVTKVVESVAQRALRLLPFNRTTVALIDADQNGFSVVRANVRAGNTVEITNDHSISLERTALGRTYLDRQEHLYHAGDQETQYYDDLKAWRTSGENVGIVLPLLTGGQCLGAMHIGSDVLSLNKFNEFVPLIKRMAQLVAASIQNARLFDQAVNLRVLNESVIESIQQGIIVLDNSGRIISINQFMRQRYHWEDRAIGLDIFAYRPEIAEVIKTELRVVLQSGIPQETLNQSTQEGDGIRLVRNFYLYPLRSENSVRGAVLMVEDVTERAELEQAMESRANQLAALTEVSTRITSSLERDEVVNLALSEMEYLLSFDSMTLWRRNGSFMVLEGAAGITEAEQEEIKRNKEHRLRINDYERVRQVVDTQRVVVLNQTLESPLIGETQAHTWLGVPLVNQGHVVGMVILTRNDSNAYTSTSDQNIAFAFASQVAIALANADLFEQTFDRTNELGTLFEAAQATSLTQDLDSVFRTVVELMFNALDMDECLIMIWDEVDNELDVQIDVNRYGKTERIQPVGTRYNLAKYPAKLKALREREVIVILHDDQEVPFPSELEELRKTNDAARMFVPLVVREQAIGLIQLEQHTIDNRQMTQQKIRLARALGAQVAVAIENARLSNQMSQMFNEALIINDLSQAISSSLNVRDMINVVRDRVPGVTGSEELYLALYDEKTGMMNFPLAVKGGKEYEIPARPLNDDEVSFVIKHRRLLSLGADYFSPDELRKSLGIRNGEGDIKSYMGVPLSSGDKVFGVLALRDTGRTRAFTINDQRILTTVGSQLGAAIQNAQLFEQISNFADDLNRTVEERTRELEEERDRIDTLYQITSELARTLDMDRLLKRALGMVAKAVNAEDGVIMALDPLSDSLYSQAALNPAMVYEDEEGRLTHPAEKLGAWLMQSDEQVITIGNLLEFEHWDVNTPNAEGWQSALAVVLESNENDPQGVMVMLSNKPNAFGEAQLRLMVAAANQVASAINNADLYHLIRDQAERLGTLLRAEQEEAEKNSAILESIADGVILSDAQGRIILFNSAAERILQLPREQVLGQPLSKFTGIYGGAVASWAETIQNRMDRPDLVTLGDYVDNRLQLGDRIVSANLSPVYTGDKFLGMVSVFRDITRDVEVDRMKGEFVASVSHELRTPLTPIKGYTDLLLMGAAGEINDAQRRVLSTIKENVDRLTVLVEDVLDISKMDTGKEKLKLDRIDLHELLNTVVTSLRQRPTHQRKELVLAVDVGEDVPMIQADRDKLNRIMSNLIDNAFNYTRSGGSIDVIARLQSDGKRVLISVKDTGVGIPEHFREDVWRRFQRYEEHALKLEVPGTGLGLAIVKEMVEMHNGDVWFESEVDKGTTFYVMLPVDQTDFNPTRTTSTGILRQVTEE